MCGVLEIDGRHALGARLELDFDAAVVEKMLSDLRKQEEKEVR